MWSKIVVTLSLISKVLAEVTAPGIDRTVSDGVKSLGYKVVYGDEDMTVINEVVSDVEKLDGLKSRINLNEAIKPLPAEDVKCLMSVDRYCSREMGKMKSVLIQALKEECVKCSKTEKEEAGKIVAAMMAHDPIAWKHFLTRSALQILPEKKPPKLDSNRYKVVGDPEYIENSRNRYTMPGVKVRVKKYAMEKIN
ncbi:uncharacterized protein [Epargyreus clarus]|uniref:uncharacterized protein n=1 Tax=Epargyreus clarus TaxID=520877 RepID=UPI003C2F3542